MGTNLLRLYRECSGHLIRGSRNLTGHPVFAPFTAPVLVQGELSAGHLVSCRAVKPVAQFSRPVDHASAVFAELAEAFRMNLVVAVACRPSSVGACGGNDPGKLRRLGTPIHDSARKDA